MSAGTLFKLGRPRAMSRLGAGARPIAVEFGVSALRALQVTGGSPPTLVAAASVETPENLRSDPQGRLEWQLQQLPRLIKQGGFKGRKAVCVVPAAATFCKHMQFTPGDGVGLAAIVESALPAELGQPASSLVMRHLEVGGAQAGNGRHEVICMATPRDLVVRLMQALKAAKLQPVGVHTEFQALLKAVAPEDEEPTLYLDLSWTSTKAVIAHGEKLVFARMIDCGGRHLDETIAQAADCELSQARTVRLSLAALTHEEVQTPDTSEPHAAESPTPERRAATSQDASLPEGGAPSEESGDSMALLSAGMAQEQARATRGDSAPEGVQESSHRARDDAATATPPAEGAPDARDGTPPGAEEQSPATVDEAPGIVRGTTLRGGLPLPPGLDLSEPLEILADEVLMCLRYHEGLFPGRRVRRVVFMGGESRQAALCEALARRLHLPAQCVDPAARMGGVGRPETPGVDFARPQPEWAVTLGACLSPTDL